MSTPTPVTSGEGPTGSSSGSARAQDRGTVASEAERVAATVRALPGVADLYAGGTTPLATYLPGRRVLGVRVDEDAVQVAVVASAGASVPSLAGQVRAALADVAAGRRVDVHVGDVRLPGEDDAQDAPPALPPGRGEDPATTTA